jgi:hypothetical protein
LLEHKLGALDQAAPLVGWGLPAEFATLRRWSYPDSVDGVGLGN